MPSWIWFVGGLVLLLFELMTPGGFFFVFFGIAGLSVGALAMLGVGPDWLLLLVFSLLSVGSLLLFRGPMLRRLSPAKGPEHAVDSLVGSVVVLMEDVPANGTGKAELRGTGWSVQNLADEALAVGRRCVVVRVEGLKLVVRPE
jgi:membrane protein implicated in regulation of membrane protease activity